MKKIYLLLITLIFLLFTSLARADSWVTPEGDVIRTGMNKAEVVMRAGQPDGKEDISCDESTNLKLSAFYYYTQDDQGNREAVTLIFKGVRLIKIETQIIR